MKRLLPLLLLVASSAIIVSAKAQSINFTIDYPSNYQVFTGTTMTVYGTIINSTYEVVNIRAVTQGRTDTFRIEAAGIPGDPVTYSGTVNIAGYPQLVPLKLMVIATDALGNERSDSTYYQCNLLPPPPTAALLLPSAGTNAYPSLHIKTAHTGTDTCTSVVVVKIANVVTFTYTSVYNDIDTSIAVSSALLGAATVSLTVKDKRNQTATATTNILADNFLYATPIYTATGTIADYNFHRILENRNNSLYILQDSNWQSQTALPSSANTSAAQLTLYGAVWNTTDAGGMEFTNDTLYRNAPFGKTAGKYSTYLQSFNEGGGYFGKTVMLKNMQTRSITSVEDIAGSGYFADPIVAENGLVVYTQLDAVNISKSQNGTRTNIGIGVGSGNYQFFNPVTDGTNILFVRRDNSLGAQEILWHNGTNTTILSSIGDENGIEATNPTNYTVNNKFMAYNKPGTSGQLQVWLKDSTGTSTQITYMGSSSYIIALSPLGDLIYKSPDTSGIYRIYYLKRSATAAKLLNPIYGRLIYRDSAWYVINGRYLSRLNVDAFRTVASGLWSSAASWENGQVPTPNADVVVTTNITINSNIICNSLKVVPPGSITVAPGVTVTVIH